MSTVRRDLQSHLAGLARRHPIVTVTGPRQSGKTTLCRAAFPRKPWVSLETPHLREYARTDPVAFLREHRSGAILDEVQRVPELLSYLQVEVDERPVPGRFILTGSQNLTLVGVISQSLAGRAALVQLLPLSLDETRRFPRAPKNLWDAVWTGGYPAIFDRRVPADEWLASYVTTYVERDVRSVLNVTDLVTFQTFVRLCAARSGQLLNLSALASDAGVTHPTAKAWISVLETTFIAFRLLPWRVNLTSRLVKTPKLHFWDSGLLCFLLGIQDAQQLEHHPLRGAIFESWVVSEVAKAFLHRGRQPTLSFYRDVKGLEVDLIFESGGRATAIECKSAATISGDAFHALLSLEKKTEAKLDRWLVYGGDEGQRRTVGRAVPWGEVGHAVAERVQRRSTTRA